MKVGHVGSAIPVVSDVTTIHNLAIDVSQISIWHLFVLGEVVMQHITANGQVTIVEVVVTRPALASELLTSDDQGVEHAQTEEECLELRGFVSLCSLKLFVVEFREGTAEIGLQVLWGLIRHLDSILQNRLRNDFHLRQTWRLG